MKLFLASEVKHPDSIESLKRFIGGFESKSIAYIPTAANGEEPYGIWKNESPTWNLINTLGAQITPVVLEEYRNSSVLSILEGKDIIWFGGGMPGYLMYWIRRCEIDKHIREYLDSGSIYVGSSAGSMITAPTLEITEWYLGESEVGGSIIPGLGLVDFEIYPNYKDELLPEIKKHWKNNQLYLLQNGEAIIVVDEEIEVLGEERILRRE